MDPFVELFTPSLWMSDPREGSLHPLYIALGLLFVAGVIGSIVVAATAPRLAKNHRIKIRVLREMAAWVGGISAAGVFWILCRMLASPLFARPMWLWVTVIALIAVGIYYALYWRRRYPPLAQAYAAAERHRRWAPTPKRRAAARRR